MGFSHAEVDELFLFVVKNLPQALLLALVAFVAILVLKDIAGGFRRPFLNPDRWQALPLVDKKVLTHNTRRFRFALPHADQVLGLPLGQHISLKVVLDDGTEVIRPYTPVSDNAQRGHVDFVIKVYQEGKMTQALDALPIGAKVLFKGPRGRFAYSSGDWKQIGMLAGGTGIAPMYQLAQAILKDPNDKTQLSLVFGNLSEDDILLRDELEALVEAHPRHFKVYHVLNSAPKGWDGGVGFITEKMITDHLPAPGAGVLALRCGPLPMNKAMEAHLDALGYPKEAQFQF